MAWRRGCGIPKEKGLFFRERTLAIRHQKIMRQKLAVPETEPKLYKRVEDLFPWFFLKRLSQ
jgi:hypothetical protein